jgi:hypothetical protein
VGIDPPFPDEPARTGPARGAVAGLGEWLAEFFGEVGEFIGEVGSGEWPVAVLGFGALVEQVEVDVARLD